MAVTDAVGGIETSYEQGILHVGLRRPGKKNALNLAMYASLVRILDEADRDDSVRVLFIYGGDECFTSGNDLSDFSRFSDVESASPVLDFLSRISRFRKPVVAAVHGLAVGIGTTLLLHCDLVYAADNAIFQLPFVRLGLCPEAASSYLLPRLAGHRRAAELLMLAEPFSSELAREIGLVNHVLPAEQIIDTALNAARKLAAMPAEAIRITKELLKASFAGPVHSALDQESRYFMELLEKPDSRKAIAAFFEKRSGESGEG